MPFFRPPRRPDLRRLRPQMEAAEPRCLLTSLPGLDPLGAVEPTKTAAAPATSISNGYDAVIGASAVRAAYGVSGAGMTAAIIDTGVEYDHPALGGGYGAGKVVVDGYDFGEGDMDPKSTGWPHGTAVAGLIASRDPLRPGVAPGAEIAALRVFADSGKGSFDWIADSLQWVLNNRQRLNITVVNLSLSDGRNYLPDQVPDSPVIDRIRSLVDQLAAVRVPVVAAAGNSYTGQQGMGFTAILPNTISVSSTDGADRLVADAQRLGSAAGGNSATDLVAPGADLAAPGPGKTFTKVTGTSFAAPLVTGSVVLLQQIYRARFGELPTVEQINTWLKAGADTIKDAATGSTFGRLDVAASAALIPAKTGSTSPQGGIAANPTQPSGGTALPPTSAPAAPSSPSAPATSNKPSVPASKPSSPPAAPASPPSSPSANAGSSSPQATSPGSAKPADPAKPTGNTPVAAKPATGTSSSSTSSQGNSSAGKSSGSAATASTPAGATAAAGGKQASTPASASQPVAPVSSTAPVAPAPMPPAISLTEEQDKTPAEAVAAPVVPSATPEPSPVDLVLADPALLAPAIDLPQDEAPRVEELDVPNVVSLPVTTPPPDPSTPAGRRAVRLALLEARRLQRESLRSSNRAIRARLFAGLEPVAPPAVGPTGPGQHQS